MSRSRSYRRFLPLFALLVVLASGVPTMDAKPVSAQDDAAEDGERPGVIRFAVTGLDPLEGDLVCGLYRDDESWLTPEAFRGAVAPIRSSRTECVIEDVPPGRYAVSAFHDEDSDRNLARGIFGIPREGWAASRGAHLDRMGKPRFEDALFIFRGGTARLETRVRY